MSLEKRNLSIRVKNRRDLKTAIEQQLASQFSNKTLESEAHENEPELSTSVVPQEISGTMQLSGYNETMRKLGYSPKQHLPDTARLTTQALDVNTIFPELSSIAQDNELVLRLLEMRLSGRGIEDTPLAMLNELNQEANMLAFMRACDTLSIKFGRKEFDNYTTQCASRIQKNLNPSFKDMYPNIINYIDAIPEVNAKRMAELVLAGNMDVDIFAKIENLDINQLRQAELWLMKIGNDFNKIEFASASRKLLVMATSESGRAPGDFNPRDKHMRLLLEVYHVIHDNRMRDKNLRGKSMWNIKEEVKFYKNNQPDDCTMCELTAIENLNLNVENIEELEELLKKYLRADKPTPQIP
jgi:hypothetical protein